MQATGFLNYLPYIALRQSLHEEIIAVKIVAWIVRKVLIQMYFLFVFFVVVLSEVLPWVRQVLATSLGDSAAVYKTVT